MTKPTRTILAAATAVALGLGSFAAPALAADTQGRNGIAGAADALRNELAPSLSTYERLQQESAPAEGIDISTARVQGLQDVMYDGQEKAPVITLKLDGTKETDTASGSGTGIAGGTAAASRTATETTLRQGEDFDVAFSGDTVNPGTVGVTITGKGDYVGTIETGFTIVPGDLSRATVDVIADQKRTGQPIEPDPVVRLNGHELARDVDYTVAYSDNVEEGTATLVVTGMGTCTGDVRATFEIVENPDAARASNANALPLAIGAAALAAVAVLAGLAFATRRRAGHARPSSAISGRRP